MRASRIRPTVAGSLWDPTRLLAENVQRALADLSMVWIDDAGFVLVIDMLRFDEAVPQHWRVGAFTLGTPAALIEDDLQAVISTREKDWIADESSLRTTG
jgi:hypothetical protein